MGGNKPICFKNHYGQDLGSILHMAGKQDVGEDSLYARTASLALGASSTAQLLIPVLRFRAEDSIRDEAWMNLALFMVSLGLCYFTEPQFFLLTFFLSPNFLMCKWGLWCLLTSQSYHMGNWKLIRKLRRTQES